MDELSNEERYFLEQDQRQRAKWRAELEAKAEAATKHQALADQVGVDNEQIVRRIAELGFNAETASVLHLMPLIAVAWADDSVSSREREAILTAARAHGIEPGTEAATLLASLLEQRPKEDVLDQILEVIKDVLAARDMHPASIVDACLNVADASGGFLGFGNRISDEEKAQIEKIAADLNVDSDHKVARRLDL